MLARIRRGRAPTLTVEALVLTLAGWGTSAEELDHPSSLVSGGAVVGLSELVAVAEFLEPTHTAQNHPPVSYF